MERTLRARPPPPPPPPPRRPSIGRVRERKDQEEMKDQQQEQQYHEPQPGPDEPVRELGLQQNPPMQQEYLLTVKYPRESPTNSTLDGIPRPARRVAMEVVQIQVYPGMSSDVLAKCVTQAIAQFSTNGGVESWLVGLFGERDRIFCSFEHILASPNPTRQAYCTVLPPPPIEIEEEPRPWMTTEMWLGVAFVGLILVYVWIYLGGPNKTLFYLELAIIILQERILGAVSSVHEWVFNLPFRELYRSGPHWIGWEGLPLAEVCNRITHFGGRDFWKRNMGECEEIYAGKEEAFLRTLRPVAYTILCILLFFIIQSLVVSYGESKRDRTDRAVVEAYHAFQTLVRIASRQAGGNHQYERRRH